MHCGLPVVASTVKGHEDLITDGETGLLFPPNDEQACAQQIRALKATPHLFPHLSRQATAAAEQYRLERVLPKVMATYQSVLPELDLSITVSANSSIS